MKTEDAPETEEVDEFRPVPNRETLRSAGLTLPRRRSGHFRRQAIKRMRKDLREVLGYEVLG